MFDVAESQNSAISHGVTEVVGIFRRSAVGSRRPVNCCRYARPTAFHLAYLDDPVAIWQARRHVLRKFLPEEGGFVFFGRNFAVQLFWMSFPASPHASLGTTASDCRSALQHGLN